jgi:hypothetical protein
MPDISLLDPDLWERVAGEYERSCEAFDAASHDQSAASYRQLADCTGRLMRAAARVMLEVEELLTPPS